MKFQLTENINKPLRLVEDAKDDMINVLRQELQAHGIPDPTNGNQPQNNQIDIQNAKNILIDFSKKIKLKANQFIKAGMDPNDLEKIAGKNLNNGYSFRLKGDSLALVYTSGWYYVYDTKTDIFRRFSRTNSNYKDINAASQDYIKIMDLFSQSITKFGNEYLQFLDEQLRKFKKNNQNSSNQNNNNQNNNNQNNNQNSTQKDSTPDKLQNLPNGIDIKSVQNEIKEYINTQINPLLNPYISADEDPRVSRMGNTTVIRTYPNKNKVQLYMRIADIGTRNQQGYYLSVSNDKKMMVYFKPDDNSLWQKTDDYSDHGTQISDSGEYARYLYAMLLAIKPDNDAIKKDQTGNFTISNDKFDDHFSKQLDIYLKKDTSSEVEIKDEYQYLTTIKGFIEKFTKIIKKTKAFTDNLEDFTLPANNNHRDIVFKDGVDLDKLFEPANFTFNTNKVQFNDIDIDQRHIQVSVSKYGLFIVKINGTNYTYNGKFIYLRNNTPIEINKNQDIKLYITILYLFKKTVDEANNIGYIDNITKIYNEVETQAKK